ncbi:hypothetical protein [Nocardioides houyundeii]|uniref:hypothetical protein n=1 Tax=Nocardioides houyundeii TaxID=2045452 RepID=UPI00131562A4|nr:hypothetical protein [Nocardioides houyundeii]
MTVQRIATAMAALAAASVLAALLVWVGAGRGADPVHLAAGPGTGAPLEVLAAWDAQRARAWAHGDVPGLRKLYVPGSRTGRRDARMLERYVDRGLVVTGLTTQVLELGPVRQGTDRLVLDVVDRVAAAQAVGEEIRTDLPRDRPSRRRVELRRLGERWLVVEVRDLPSSDSGVSTSGPG